MLEQIKASAGSGKTYTLTRRFLEELSRLGEFCDDLPCRKTAKRGPGAFSEILAMTFTNKAAAEMKARVLAELKKIALRQGHEPDRESGISPEQARDWLEIILRRYDSLNIRTIDSLLNLLLQISAINLDIPPDFELAFDERDFLEPLYDELLDKADQGDEEISRLLHECAAGILSADKASGLTSRGKIRERLLDILEKLHGSMADDLPCVERGVIEEAQKLAHEGLLAEARALEAELDRLSLKPGKNFSNFMEKVWAYEPGQKFPTSLMVGKASFTECCNKAEQHRVDDALEDAYQAFCAAVAKGQQKMNLYDSALSLLPFARLAIMLLPEIRRLQAEQSKIAGSLLPLLAGEVLGGENGVSEACCRLGSRLNHILIDEFQDTSREQWQAILPLAEECLSRGGSLRYVGDVKQAIYSWRGGDSRLFDEIVEPHGDLTGMEPAPRLTALEYNWRSAPEIVRHNNAFFSRLAEPETAYTTIKALLHKDYPDDCAREAASVLSRAFADTAQNLPDRAKDGPCGFVTIQKVGGAGVNELYDDIKARLKTLFADLLQRHAPGDIALLVRGKGEAAVLADWMAEWGIGLVTEHSFKLAGNPLIRRLVSLLRWLDYPADDLNFLAFVSGAELFGRVSSISPETVLRWEAGARRRDKKQPLYRLFMDEFPEAWALWLEPFYRRSGLMSAYDVISEIYNRYSLLASSPGHAVYLRRFLELVLGAEKSGYSSLSGFLEFWDDKGQEEKIPAPENPDAVRLLTIHKSKGLEFKVVVMPFNRFSGKGRAQSALCRVDGLPLLVKEGPDLGEAFYQGKNTSAVEAINLLYVAWTRAGEELHLLVGGSELDHRSAGLSKALVYLLNGYNFSKDGFYSSGAPAKSVTPEAKKPVPEAAPLFIPSFAPSDEDWQPMSWLPKLKIFRAPVPELVYDERVRGILFHNCLENLYLPDNANERLDEIITQAADNAMRGFHLPLNHAEAARAELIRALSWFCRLPMAPYWLTHGRAEQTIMDADGQNHRMDMLVEEPDGSLLVLEYKTGRPRPEYAEQARRYLGLLAESGAVRPRGLIVYLDLQELEEVRL